MNIMNLFRKFSMLIAAGVVAVSCVDENNISNNPIVEEGPFSKYFDWKTTQQVELKLTVLNAGNEALESIPLAVYTKNPFVITSEGQEIMGDSSSENMVFKGMTDGNGKIELPLTVASRFDSLFVATTFPGVPTLTPIVIRNHSAEIVIGGSAIASKAVVRKSVNLGAVPTGFGSLGTWNSVGRPTYLTAPDAITADFLAVVNNSLPEYVQLPISHPEYLAKGSEANVIVKERAEVWITFVNEGAGWLNSLCYFYYNTNNPPKTASEIKNMYVVFPNVSITSSNSPLISGDKVQLKYYDETTKAFTNIWPANVTIGWCLLANGFSSSSGNVTVGTHKVYSIPEFNPESSADLKKHTVLLYDKNRQRLVIGLEDMRRDQGSDNDFNDAVFYATANPITAIETGNLPAVDTPKDEDGDGVSDKYDEYPKDPERAFNNYYPSNKRFGTLAFEDLWPSKGDYDFNDMVLDYQYKYVTNVRNEVVDLNANFLLRARGAAYNNGFAIMLPINQNKVKSVSGQKITSDVFKLNANGVENSLTEEAVIPVFDQASSVLRDWNTDPVQPKKTSEAVNLTINLQSPLALSKLGSFPLNPFVIRNKERNVEIHLPHSMPSGYANKDLFGKYNDRTDLSKGISYVSDGGLPWALDIADSFVYPIERTPIFKAYNFFETWAGSNGTKYADWYLDKTNYRNSKELYTK